MRLVVNGQSREVADGATIAQLLVELKLPDRQVAVEVNGQVVPRRDHAASRLSPGDRLEIVTLVGGG